MAPRHNPVLETGQPPLPDIDIVVCIVRRFFRLLHSANMIGFVCPAMPHCNIVTEPDPAAHPSIRPSAPPASVQTSCEQGLAAGRS